MSSRKKIVADLLFGVQIVCTLIFGGLQFLRMLTTSQGVSITWFGFWEAFLLLNLLLAHRAHRVKPERVTLQVFLSYSLWTIMVTLDLSVMIVKGNWTWNGRDTATVALAALGIAVTLLIAFLNNLGIADPIVKGYLAVCFKAIPQLIMAHNIFVVGGAGLAATTVVTGHITVLTRLGQLVFTIKAAGWDRNRTGSAISEIANEVTWAIVTIAWLLR